MIFWVLAALMAVAVVLALLWPLARARAAAPSTAEFDRTVYRDQLAELDQDLERGLIDKTEAEAARREIERRLLQTEGAETAPAPVAGGGWRRVALVLIIALPPAVGLGLYLQLGTPDLPDLPLAERNPGGPLEVGLLEKRLKERIEAEPRDMESRLILAQVYMRTQRYGEAVDVYRAAIAEMKKVGPVPGALQAALGESLVAQNQGQVGREARLAFAAAIEADPGNVRARYYAGLAMAQDGKLENAIDVWKGLAEDLPASSPMIDLLRQQIAKAAEEAGVEPPELALRSAPPASAAPSGPSAADVEAAQEMTPEERQNFIRSMVARLAERLDAQPDDPDGWLRLARAYLVLGEAGKAKQALDSAETRIAALPEDAPERADLTQRLEGLRGSLPE